MWVWGFLNVGTPVPNGSGGHLPGLCLPILALGSGTLHPPILGVLGIPSWGWP